MKKRLEIKKNIEGFYDVTNTVKTIEKIAASNIHRLRGEVKQLNIYHATLLKELSYMNMLPRDTHPLFQTHEEGKTLYLVVGGDMGFVGGLYHGLLDVLVEESDFSNEFMCIGTHLASDLKEIGVTVSKVFPSEAGLSLYADVEEISREIFSNYALGEYRTVQVVYPKFVSVMIQSATSVQLLPFQWEITEAGHEDATQGFPIYDSNVDAMFEYLMSRFIHISLARFVSESKLSELSARTTTMEHASAKADEVIVEQRRLYNEVRREEVSIDQMEGFMSLIHHTS